MTGFVKDAGLPPRLIAGVPVRSNEDKREIVRALIRAIDAAREPEPRSATDVTSRAVGKFSVDL